MSNSYPPQGAGQPNQPPSPYGQGPNQPPQYGQGPAQNYPPVTPTPPVYYAPPPGPNPNPYGTPPTGQPYPPAPYPGQVARPAKAKGGRGGLIAVGVIGLIVVVALVLGILGVFNTVEASDYPGATNASLTDKGTTYVNGLYNNNSSDRDNRKVFVTRDTPDQVFQFYKSDLVKKGWTFNKDGQLDGIAASQFSKSGDLIIVIAGGPAEGLIKDEGTQNFIIVVTGKDV
jgi:hypothetical protein